MENFKDILKEFRSIGADYKAEVLAAEIESNHSVDADIYFRTLSTFKRSVANDVAGLEWEDGEDGRDRLFFLVNREGLYDMIPQGITHYNPGKDARGKVTFVEEIKYQRGLEAQARKFFLPIEDEFFHQRLKLETLEREFDNRKNAGRNRELFETLFGDSTLFDDLQVLTLLYILPLASRIRGDAEQTAFCMGRILGYRVSLETKWEPSHSGGLPALPGLDSMTLGMDSILAGGFRTVLLHYHLHIHGIGTDDYSHFLENGRSYQVLQRLIGWFLPINNPLELHLNPGQEQPAWVLGDEDTPGFLGYNTGN